MTVDRALPVVDEILFGFALDELRRLQREADFMRYGVCEHRGYESLRETFRLPTKSVDER